MERKDARERPDADVALCAFDAADVSAVQAGELGQDFLRLAAGGAQSTHRDFVWETKLLKPINSDEILLEDFL